MSVHAADERTYDSKGRWRTSTYAHSSEAGAVGQALYISGDEFTDGSDRIIVDPLDDTPTVQERATSVWNTGELQLAQGALILDRAIKLSALAQHLLITHPVAPQRIVLDQGFNDFGAGFPESTILDTLVVRLVIQPDDSMELVLTQHASLIVPVGLNLSSQAYLKTGTVAASDDVILVFSEGIPPDDIIFFRQNFPASVFPANTEVIIDMSPGVNFDSGVQINGFITSSAAFALRYDTSSTLLWFALDTQIQGDEDLLTETLVLSNDLDITFSNALELARGNPVFS